LKKVICMQCHNACRLAAEVEEDRLVSVEPDEMFPGAKSSYPITKGCPRRRNVLEYFYHPGRLNYPLKRAGARGENKWQKISWDDAFGEIGARIKKIIDQHGWWYPEEEGAEPSLHGVWKSNCNVLTDDDPDICNPISGGWPLRTLLCKVYKAPEQ